MQEKSGQQVQGGRADGVTDSGRLREIGLLGGDLMALSRVTSIGRQLGIGVRQVNSAADLDGLALLLVDLNRDADLELGRLAELLSPSSELRAIAVGRHTELAWLLPRAKAAGAQRCVANSGLPMLLARILVAGRGADSAPEAEPS
jgi:hypothetical protein